GRAADRGGRGHPDRVRHHRADRHPRRVPRGGGDPGHMGQRVRGDDPAHQERRGVLRVHLGGPGPGHRGGRRAAGVFLPPGGTVRGVRAERCRRGVRAPGAARGVVGVGAWAVVTVLGLGRVDITGRVLGVLLCAEIAVTGAETVAGLAHPAGGHLSFATLSPGALTSAGPGAIGVLAVVAVLGFVGFEQAPVLAEEAKNARRTVPVATYVALGMIAVLYAG